MHHGQIRVGDYCFEPETFLLSSKAQDIALEPKVGSLLLYLFQHRDRYVALPELHAQVWPGLFVSDTAVRRAISKLRRVLGDDVDNPSYIKSLPKRGYRLIADCMVRSTDGNHEFSDPEIFLVSGGQLQAESTAPHPHGKKKLVLMLLILFLMVAVVFYLGYARLMIDNGQAKGEILALQAVIGEPLDTLASRKLSMALSSDGKQLAFSARSGESEPYRLYLKDLQSGSIRQLTDNAAHVYYMTFVNEDSELVYSQVSEEGSGLYAISTAPDSQQPREIFSQRGGFVGNVAAIPNSKSVIASVQSNEPAQSVIYRFDLDTLERQELTFAASEDTIDYLALPSPDGRYLAYARWTKDGNVLTVIQLASGAPIRTLNLTRPLYNLVWHNNEQLLLLDKNYLKEYSLATGQLKERYTNTHGNVKNIVKRNESEALLLVSPSFEVKLGEVRIEKPEQLLRMKKVESERVMSFYGWQAGQRIALKNLPIGSEIVLYHEGQDGEESLVHSHHPMFIFDVSQVRPLLLYSLQGQLWLYDAETRTQQAITKASQFLLHASISRDGSGVYYCEKRQGESRCYQTPVQTDSLKLIANHTEVIKDAGNGFVVARADGRIQMLNRAFEVTGELPFSIDRFNNASHVEVSQQHIVWSELDSGTRQVIFHIYDRQSGQYKRLNRSQDTLSVYFDMSAGSEYLLQQIKTIPYGRFHPLSLTGGSS